MKSKKKTILLAQFLLFFIAIILIYFTYYNKKPMNKPISEDSIIKNSKNLEKKNSFTDVQYRGLDLNGNRFMIESEAAEFEIDKPNEIYMKKMIGFFYFKDGSVLKIISDKGKYNTQNQDTEFRGNIIAQHEDDVIYSDNIDYFNSAGLLKVYGSVEANTEHGELSADLINVDLNTKTLDISMYNNSLIDVKVTK